MRFEVGKYYKCTRIGDIIQITDVDIHANRICFNVINNHPTWGGNSIGKATIGGYTTAFYQEYKIADTPLWKVLNDC